MVDSTIFDPDNRMVGDVSQLLFTLVFGVLENSTIQLFREHVRQCIRDNIQATFSMLDLKVMSWKFQVPSGKST